MYIYKVYIVIAVKVQIGHLHTIQVCNYYKE